VPAENRFCAPIFAEKMVLVYEAAAEGFRDLGPRKGKALAEKPDGMMVQAALHGDVNSFTELCSRYYSAMVAVAHAILGDRHLAEDAAQEAFARACWNLKRLKDPNRFAAWLARICRNQAKDMARRRRRLRSLPDPAAMPERLQTAADVDTVRDAIETLPARAREVIYLRYYDELSYEQMSAVLGISGQAVNGRLRRAKKAVARYLERNGRVRVRR